MGVVTMTNRLLFTTGFTLYLSIVGRLAVVHSFTVVSVSPSSTTTHPKLGSTEVAQQRPSSRSNTNTRLFDGTLTESGDILDEEEGNFQTEIKDLINGVSNGEVTIGEDDEVEGGEEEEVDEQMLIDREMMNKAIQQAQSCGGERGSHSPFPKAIVGAVLVGSNSEILGTGRSNYQTHAIQAAISSAGIHATPLSEWCVTWPKDSKLRENLRESTLYVTLEPSAERQGTSLPPITQLIQMSGIPRVVIGCADPILEMASEGAATLHSAGLEVTMGVLEEECQSLIEQYAVLANGKLQKMARNHFERFGRPLGFLHCSVVDSDDVQSFARNGNAFGKNFGGKHLSFRDFGSYELAPPPESIWARDSEKEEADFTEVDDFFEMDFEEENEQESLGTSPMMPWYEQVDAVVGTFPREGNGPANDNSVSARLNSLKWLATNGNSLPANVERILVMDATDLADLPLTNDDPNLPKGVDIEAFWNANGRKASRVLLRHGDNAQAIAAANAAAEAAKGAADAAQRAREALETGEAEEAAEAALECQEAALAATKALQKEVQVSQDLKQKLVNLGIKVEVIKGKDPIDVMNYLGKTNGYKSVVWRAGCWGQRGVEAIIDGAFQWVSAHLAVDAAGGKFWQLMLAERAIQAACGPESKVKVLAEQEDISLEYCDEEDPDTDCVLTVDGRPIRHVRLDSRVLVVDPDRPHEYVFTKTVPFKDKMDEAPWFL